MRSLDHFGSIFYSGSPAATLHPMLTRLTGTLEALSGTMATITPDGPLGQTLALEVLLPAFLAQKLTTSVGSRITLHTYFYLEGQGQGTSFEPRILGFSSPDERAFFELFTTVKGIGNRKALRALAEPPGTIAAAIVRGDAKALTALPEIGKRLAETIIAELKGKVDAYASASDLGPHPRKKPMAQVESTLTGPAADAVEALVRLGEQRAEAERKVVKAIGQHAGSALATERIVQLVFAGV